MDTALLTRSVTFAAAHRYYRPEWDDARNRQVFGACSNPHGHGHNYRLDVTVRAAIDAVTGFSADLAELDRILLEEVVHPLDHQHLNHAVEDFAEGRAIPTCENILRWIWPRVAARITAPAHLHSLRLHEDEHLHVEYFGGAEMPA